MKKIIILIIVLTLGVTAYTSYKTYSKINSPSFGYDIPNNIDINYHNEKTTSEYLSLVTKLESYGRKVWYNHRISVLHIDENSDKSIKFSKHYNLLLSRVKFLEKKLQYSYFEKERGFLSLIHI